MLHLSLPSISASPQTEFRDRLQSLAPQKGSFQGWLIVRIKDGVPVLEKTYNIFKVLAEKWGQRQGRCNLMDSTLKEAVALHFLESNQALIQGSDLEAIKRLAQRVGFKKDDLNAAAAHPEFHNLLVKIFNPSFQQTELEESPLETFKQNHQELNKYNAAYHGIIEKMQGVVKRKLEPLVPANNPSDSRLLNNKVITLEQQQQQKSEVTEEEAVARNSPDAHELPPEPVSTKSTSTPVHVQIVPSNDTNEIAQDNTNKTAIQKKETQSLTLPKQAQSSGRWNLLKTMGVIAAVVGGGWKVFGASSVVSPTGTPSSNGLEVGNSTNRLLRDRLSVDNIFPENTISTLTNDEVLVKMNPQVLTTDSQVEIAATSVAPFEEAKATEDPSKRFELYKLAAEKGVSEAQYETGKCYLWESGISRNLKNACKWFEDAANQGHKEAQYEIGECYLYGRGTAQDMVKGFRWLESAANQRDMEAQYKVGECYHLGRGVERNQVEAFKWYKASAEQGNSAAQYEVGMHYLKGNGVQENKEEAIRWLKLAVHQRNLSAQSELEKLQPDESLDNERRTDQAELNILSDTAESLFVQAQATEDPSKRFQVYKLAAKKGVAEAQYETGKCYLWGNGVSRNLKNACKWFEDAANQGHKEAQYEIGECYLYGRGIAQDMVKGFRWLESVANQGDMEAQYEVGECYHLGRGVERNQVEAFKWYKASAEQGNSQAQYEVGMYYLKGNGVQENKEEAIRWLKLAAHQRNLSAKSKLEKLQEKT